jgi:hypothetical protein
MNYIAIANRIDAIEAFEKASFFMRQKFFAYLIP